MSTVLVDTHIVLWLDAGDAQLRNVTVEFLDGHRRAGGTVAVSAVTAWEISLLADRGRIALDLSALAWLSRFLARPGMTSAPLTATAAATAYSFEGLPHRDPADRLLIATAIENHWPLVTYDQDILDFAAGPGAARGFSARTH